MDTTSFEEEENISNKIDCQFSVEGLAYELELSEQDIKEGSVFTQAEMKAKHK